jgi:hypothetical protein
VVATAGAPAGAVAPAVEGAATAVGDAATVAGKEDVA